MATFPIAWPSKPAGSAPISATTKAYFRARNQHRAHALVIDAFARSGITQAQLARRCRKRPEVISRILGEPGNWTLNTFSDIIFAISGGEPAYSIEHPLDAPPRNQDAPAWLSEGTAEFGVRSDRGSKKIAQLELTP